MILLYIEQKNIDITPLSRYIGTQSYSEKRIIAHIYIYYYKYFHL